MTTTTRRQTGDCQPTHHDRELARQLVVELINRGRSLRDISEAVRLRMIRALVVLRSPLVDDEDASKQMRQATALCDAISDLKASQR